MTRRIHRRQLPSADWVFVKEDEDAPPGFFEAEAAGLRWLAETGTVLIPDLVSVTATSITVTAITPGTPTKAAAAALGRQLAQLHSVDAGSFGAAWPGFVGPLPMDNRVSTDWATFYAQRRVLPFLQLARDGGAIDPRGVAIIESALEHIDELPGANETPRRLHGDLWSGNLVWDTKAQVWLIDPAAHGGHRETDLAMLALFGAPHLSHVLASYRERSPLADGWEARVGLHQLHPLLVHAVLFGPSYGDQAVQMAEHRTW